MNFINRTSLKFILQFVLIVMASFLIISAVSIYTGAKDTEIEKENLLPQAEKEF